MNNELEIIDYTDKIIKGHIVLNDIGQNLKNYDADLDKIKIKTDNLVGATKDGIQELIKNQQQLIDTSINLIASIKAGVSSKAYAIKEESMQRIKSEKFNTSMKG